MRYTLMATAIGSVLAVQAATADVHDTFNTALAGLPASLFDDLQPAHFVNMQALVQVFGTPRLAPAMAQRGSLALDLPVYQAALSMPPGEFTAAAGIPADQIDFIAVHGARPDQAVLWGMAPAAMADLQAGLPDLGFTVMEDAGPVLANGTPGSMDLSKAGSPGPWYGSMGESSLIELRNGILYQGWSLPALQAATAGPTAAESRAGRALSEAFGQSSAERGDLITQAMFFSAGFGAASAEAAVGAEAVMPAYLGAMLADLQGAEGPVAVLAFAYPDCGLAETARAALQAGWTIETPTAPVFLTRSTAEACLTTVTIADPADQTERNLAFWPVYAAMMQRGFVPVAAP